MIENMTTSAQFGAALTPAPGTREALTKDEIHELEAAANCMGFGRTHNALRKALAALASSALLQHVMEAAEALSAAMVESEANGADYEMVDQQWQQLTVAIQAVYAARSEDQK